MCGGAPFNVTNPSNDVQVVNIGLNGFNPKITSNTSPQRAPTDTAVATKHLPVVVPVAYFAPRIVAGMNNTPNKKFTKSIFAGQTGTSRSGSNFSSLGTGKPRDQEDDDMLGRHELVSLLLPSEATPGSVPTTPIVGTPSIQTMATFGRRFGQSLPPFVEIKSKNKILTGHARRSKKIGSASWYTERWATVLSFVWLCTFIVNVESYDPLPDGTGCCDEGNILISSILIVVLF